MSKKTLQPIAIGVPKQAISTQISGTGEVIQGSYITQPGQPVKPRTARMWEHVHTGAKTPGTFQINKTPGQTFFCSFLVITYNTGVLGNVIVYDPGGTTLIRVITDTQIGFRTWIFPVAFPFYSDTISFAIDFNLAPAPTGLLVIQLFGWEEGK